MSFVNPFESVFAITVGAYEAAILSFVKGPKIFHFGSAESEKFGHLSAMAACAVVITVKGIYSGETLDTLMAIVFVVVQIGSHHANPLRVQPNPQKFGGHLETRRRSITRRWR
jgi:hypothetical protein